jgi:pyruvate/2-oxoglutarate dehydrogenase complex dihydrolipoamide acyltransferase (E2) component
MIDIVMPRLSESMEMGRLLRWNVELGSLVREGDVVAEVETDKANMEIEALGSGKLVEISAKPGEDLPVGFVLGKLDPSGLPEGFLLQTKPASQSLQAPEGIDITPLALKRAQELGLDLTTVKGTGPAGRILSEDVEDASKKGGHKPSSNADYRFPGGFVMRSRVSALPLVQSLAHLEMACKPLPESMTREWTAAAALTLSALAAFKTTIRNRGPLETPRQELALTLITPSGIHFFDNQVGHVRTLRDLIDLWKPQKRSPIRVPGTIDFTVAIGCGLDSIEPLSPGDIHFSVSIPEPLGDSHSEICLSLTTEGDSKLPFAVDFLNSCRTILAQPLLLLEGLSR